MNLNMFIQLPIDMMYGFKEASWKSLTPEQIDRGKYKMLNGGQVSTGMIDLRYNRRKGPAKSDNRTIVSRKLCVNWVS